MREKKLTSPSSARQNGHARGGEVMSLSAAFETGADDGLGPMTSKVRASTFEPAFFFGLSVDDALQSTENIVELFYNACKYNHIDLVKRCIDEQRVNVNEPFNNDYPLCIAR